MAVEKSYAGLGFFIVLTLVLFLVTAVFFIQRLKKRPAIGLVTYTTDNVFGLDVSSAVRLRGVPVGRVTAIRVNHTARSSKSTSRCSSIALTPLAWTSAGSGRLPMLEACSPTFGPSSWATQ